MSTSSARQGATANASVKKCQFATSAFASYRRCTREAAPATFADAGTMQSDTVITPEPRSSLWPAKALRRARDVHPVWAVNIIVLSLALVLYLGPARGLAPIASPQVPWWLVAVGFALAERCVVHLHFR